MKKVNITGKNLSGRFMEKDKSLIPPGPYCYKYIEFPSKENNWRGPIKCCPYWKSKIIAGVEVPWCEYLNLGGLPNTLKDGDWRKLDNYYGNDDEEMRKELPLFLLWDGCKECGINDKWDENYGK